jgi:hypothetical protein
MNEGDVGSLRKNVIHFYMLKKRAKKVVGSETSISLI